MDLWDVEDIELVGPAFIDFEAGGGVQFRFVAVSAPAISDTDTFWKRHVPPLACRRERATEQCQTLWRGAVGRRRSGADRGLRSW